MNRNLMYLKETSFFYLAVKSKLKKNNLLLSNERFLLMREPCPPARR